MNISDEIPNNYNSMTAFRLNLEPTPALLHLTFNLYFLEKKLSGYIQFKFRSSPLSLNKTQ